MCSLYNKDNNKEHIQEETKMIVTTLNESERYYVLGENVKKALEWLKEVYYAYQERR